VEKKEDKRGEGKEERGERMEGRVRWRDVGGG
jgi:hypothetical protein